jgi:enhancing lycopene biosynthesis protein 2
MKKVAILLAGCGVFDGSEIQESVLLMLSIKDNGGSYQCFAPSIEQYHVLNHITGEEINEKRNVLIESARIARGNIKDLKDYNSLDFDALAIPGGFGDAKNLTTWAFQGSQCEINQDVKNAIVSTVTNKKPILGLCMGPTVIAKAIENSNFSATLTIGTTKEDSPYDINEIKTEVEKLGSTHIEKGISEIAIDNTNRIISAPCYMLEADISQVNNNIRLAVNELFTLME